MKNPVLMILSSLLLVCMLNSCKNDSTPLVTDDFLICRISTSDTVCKLGTVPDIKMEIVNKTGKDIILPHILDGSWWKARLPFTTLKITRFDGSLVKLSSIRRCGNVNPLKKPDFTTIPNEGILNLTPCGNPLTGWYIDSIISPGKHAFQFIYETRGSAINEWGGLDQGFTEEEFVNITNNVPKVKLISNTLVINFIEK